MESQDPTPGCASAFHRALTALRGVEGRGEMTAVIEDFTHCPAGIWTRVPGLTVQLPFVNIQSAYRGVSGLWRRYSSGPPFHGEGRAHFHKDDNLWASAG